MKHLLSETDLQETSFQTNAEVNQQLAANLKDNLSKTSLANSPSSAAAHEDDAQLLLSDRITRLLDEASPFLELSAFATCGSLSDDIGKTSGITTGIGMVNGQQVMVICSNFIADNGSYLPVAVQKHARAQQIAVENSLPCVYMLDSPSMGQVGSDSTTSSHEYLGTILHNQSKIAAQSIPQICCVFGRCVGEMSLIAAMSDETIIVNDQGSISLCDPSSVMATTGQELSEQELGGVDVAIEFSAVARDDDHALQIARNVLSDVMQPRQINGNRCASLPPRHNPEELYALTPADRIQPLEIREVIARIVDDSLFREFKAHYGTNLVTGFCRLDGQRIGIVANNGDMSVKELEKETEFIQLCDQREIPLLFLQNTAGFKTESNHDWDGLAKYSARLISTIDSVCVPKITVVVGESCGTSVHWMGSRSSQPQFLFTWPNARVEAPDADLDHMADAYYSTSRLWDDGIIDPVDTRRVLAMAFETCAHTPRSQKSFDRFQI